MPTIEKMTYEPLLAVLKAHGFTEIPNTKARVFVQDASEAELILPRVTDGEPLRAHHYVMAQAMMDDYGILTRDAFDLELARAAHRSLVAA